MTETDRKILDLEKRWAGRHDGRKDTAIRNQLGMASTIYYQRLYRLLNDSEAIAAEPVLVNRLRRLTKKAG
jgi:hypothetical protein